MLLPLAIALSSLKQPDSHRPSAKQPNFPVVAVAEIGAIAPFHPSTAKIVRTQVNIRQFWNLPQLWFYDR
jgi:hypothetical protein